MRVQMEDGVLAGRGGRGGARGGALVGLCMAIAAGSWGTAFVLQGVARPSVPALCGAPVAGGWGLQNDLPSRATNVGMKVAHHLDHPMSKIRLSDGPLINKYRMERKYERWLRHTSGYAKGKGKSAPRFSKEFKLAQRFMMGRWKHNMYKRQHIVKNKARQWARYRVRANAQLYGVTYAETIQACRQNGVWINRKMMAQLGVHDRGVLTNLYDLIMPNWREIKQERIDKRKPDTFESFEEMDETVIPFIEKLYPGLYTDNRIRFNRQVNPASITYTVDIGDPEKWRAKIARFPELQNFNLPDHWMKNPNEGKEFLPAKAFMNSSYVRDLGERALAKEESAKALRQELGQPEPTKEGVSRDAWFDEEPQSWF